MLQNLKFASIFFIILTTHLHIYAIADKPYDASDWAKIVMISAVIIVIFSPSKFRVVVIGTLLGLTIAYLTYKYLVPIFWEALTK